MTKAKMLLAISLTCFAISATGICWGLFLPAGAIVFGLFMIFNALEKESALFDEEQRSNSALAEKINQSRIEKSATSAYGLKVRGQKA
jgi:hypothetical protein